MTEEEYQRLVHRLRKIHRGERRRAWWQNRMETLALSAVFCAVAWLVWNDDYIEGACFGALGLLLVVAALA